MIILGIETSCDDTGVALVEIKQSSQDSTPTILANVVAGQNDFHQQYGGVVPEIAARKHVEMLFPSLTKAFEDAGMEMGEVDAVAVTSHPGLVGSLLVGVECAKTIALLYQKPLLAVDHLKAHFYSIAMEGVSYPYIALLVSGGHTILAICKSPIQIEVVGATLDDAGGECFDKVAKYYGLGYPGGPMVERLACEGNENSYLFPHIMARHENPFAFSFSGLKTAVIHHAKRYHQNKQLKQELYLPDLAASFQKAVVDHLLENTLKAVKKFGINRVGVCGGVSANGYLRKRFSNVPAFQAYFPRFELCTDNAAMIAGLAYHYYQNGEAVGDITGLNPAPQSFKKSKVL